MTARKIFVRLIAIIGLACLFALAFQILESRESKTRRYFSDKERVSEMTALFHRLESATPSELGLIKLEEKLGFPQSWKLPRSMVPANLQSFRKGEDLPFVGIGNVLVHFGPDGKLMAIECFSSRNGCFIHRDPSMTLPRNFDSKIPIRTVPPCITAWSEEI
ncbi:hypothetical protein [Luteolibacter soli]|uniref:Uncharacterized protein n=1 Tax=Luteolibacter soli TaxID=3135280 RepID=A0ABU9B2K6_9BACT